MAALEEKLMELLWSLSPEEWKQLTIAGGWTVKDVAAHLLDGNLRALSMMRDNYFSDPSGNIYTNEDLVHYLNGLNAGWVSALKRISPQVLTTLLETTGKEYQLQLNLLDPWTPAIFAVSWAGETASLNRFHMAREYTERWHHQQQIRDALGRQGIMTRELYYPVLDTFMMALPYTYRNTDAEDNSVVQITISGDAGGDWFLTKKEKWTLSNTNDLPVSAHTIIDGEIAWKLFTKSWRKKDVPQYVHINGHTALGEEVLNMIAVMA